MTKPTIWVSDQVQHKPACTVTEETQNLENLGRKCTIRVAKTKTLISFAVTAKLICVFVFAHANCWFSHAQAHIKVGLRGYTFHGHVIPMFNADGSVSDITSHELI